MYLKSVQTGTDNFMSFVFELYEENDIAMELTDSDFGGRW